MVEHATGERNVPGSNTTGAVSEFLAITACRTLSYGRRLITYKPLVSSFWCLCKGKKNISVAAVY